VGFKAGRITRDGLHKRYHAFSPVQTVLGIYEVPPVELVAAGKKVVMLDADNTLLPWRSEELSDVTRAWLADAKAVGLKLVLISNTRNKARLERLSAALGIPYAVGKFKPSREMYVHALEITGAKPEEAVMIGDQIFTDVWGANRAGVDSILVQPMHGREFLGTKINRLGEKWIWRQLREAMESELDDLPIVEPTGFFHRRIVRQFAKFCIVGLTSFAIDYNIRMTLMYRTTSGDGLLSDRAGGWLHENIPFIFGRFTPVGDAFLPVAAGAGAAIAILNSFLWNRMWTFSIRGKEEAAQQFQKFVAISVSGLLLNVILTSIIQQIIPGDSKSSTRIATVIVAGIVAFWNFFGQRLYAFRAKPAPSAD